MPHLDKSIIPNNVKHLFDNQQQTVIDPGGQDANEATLPLEGIHVSLRTRSRLATREAMQLWFIAYNLSPAYTGTTQYHQILGKC